MASSNGYTQLKETTYDSDNSTESNRSMEQPPSVEDRDKSLDQNVKLYITAFDCSISELQNLVNRLKHITETVEKVHRRATIGSLSGSVIGAAGGITSIVGLILAPFTLGTSLIVTGVGIGVAAAGGLTGAASNITDMIKQKTSRKEIETILKAIQNKLNPLLQRLEDIQLKLDEIQTAPFRKKAQIGFGIGRGAGYAVETIRLINFLEIGSAVSRTVSAAGAITGVLAGLFLIMDIVFIAKDAKELRQIDKKQKNGNGKSAVSKFLKEMKDTVDKLNETLVQLRDVKEQFEKNKTTC